MAMASDTTPDGFGKIDALAFIGSSRAATSSKKLHPKPHRLRILGLEAKTRHCSALRRSRPGG